MTKAGYVASWSIRGAGHQVPGPSFLSAVLSFFWGLKAPAESCAKGLEMQQQEESGQRLVSTWTADIVVAALMAFMGGIVMMDSVRLGMGWSEYGPESGYFPFYIRSDEHTSELQSLMRISYAT